MSNKILVVATPPNSAPSLAGEFNQLRDRLLAESTPITSIENETDQRNAIAIVSQLKAVTRDIEASRKIVKKPYDEAVAQINAIAREATASIALESSRLEGLMGAFQAEQRRIQFEKEQAARREQQRLAEEAEKARVDAERLRLESEKAKGKKAAALREQAEDAEIKAGEAADAVSAAPPAVIQEAPRAHGASVSEGYDIEVVDIGLLYKSYPQCIKMEPRLMAIQDLIRIGRLDIPGVKLTPKIKVAVRSASTPALR